MWIKFHANLRALWTIRVASTLICVWFFLALFQAVMLTTGLILRRHQIVVPIYIGIESIVISIIIFLQILTIQTSSSVQNQSTVRTFERINRKITKLSMRTMLLLWFFYTPHVMIIKPIRSSIRNQLNDNEKSILEFTNCMSIIFTYANSSANAVLFLTTNVKAKRYLKRFFTDWKFQYRISLIWMGKIFKKSALNQQSITQIQIWQKTERRYFISKYFIKV